MISSLCRHSARLHSFPLCGSLKSGGGGTAAQLHNPRSHNVLNKLSFLDDIRSFAPNLSIKKLRSDSLVFLSSQSEQRTPGRGGGFKATWGCKADKLPTKNSVWDFLALCQGSRSKQLLKGEWKRNEHDLSKELHNCHSRSTCQDLILFPRAPKQIYYTHTRKLSGRHTLGGKDWSDYN